MTEGKRYRYTSGLVHIENDDSAEGQFNPPKGDGPPWTLDEVSYLIVPPGNIRWIARWSRTYIIIDPPTPPETE